MTTTEPQPETEDQPELEPQPEPDDVELPDDEPGVEEQATTTATKDYMGRQLITPSVNSKDYLGRPTQSAIDYMGRLLLL
jgi:hypothetical protein